MAAPPVLMPQHFCDCCRTLLDLVWRVFFRGRARDCLSTPWPSGGVGVACELWRALVVGTADAAVCAAVCCVASLAAARRPSETQKLYVRCARGAGVGSAAFGVGCVCGAWEEWFRAWVSPWFVDSRRETVCEAGRLLVVMVRCDALTRPTAWEDYVSLRPRTREDYVSPRPRWFVSSCERESAAGCGFRFSLHEVTSW